MEDRNVLAPHGAAEVSARDTRDGGFAHLIAPLLRLTNEVYGQADRVGERFCREVLCSSRGSVRLLLWDQQAERAELAASPVMCMKLLVEYRGILYGELFVARDPHQPTYPALSSEISARLAETCGWLLHILEEAALLQVQSQHLPTEHTDPLSRHQLEVLRLMAMGQDRAAIARTLRITPATVDTHRSAVYARLGVHSPIEAILAGHRLGLILLIGSPSPPTTAPARRSKGTRTPK